MNERAGVLLEVLSADAAAEKTIDIWRRFGDMTMEVVGTTAFG